MQSTALPTLHIEPLATPVLVRSERMGRIVAVTGSKAVVLLDDHDIAFDQNKRGAEIGTLLKVETKSSITLALISALSSPMPSNNPTEKELRIVEVEFIGELPRRDDGSVANFRRGVSSYPSLGDTVFKADRSTGEPRCSGWCSPRSTPPRG